MDELLTPLDDLAHAHRLRGKATENYMRALRRCKDAGVSNVKMAKTVKVTEAAIRMYFKRKGL